MSKINLRDLYPDFYKADCIIDVPEEVLGVFVEHDRREAAYRRRVYYHKAHYSLDREDGIENSIKFVSYSPHEIYERKLTTQQLHAAIAALPDKQAKRVYAHYILGIDKAEIAKAEGVDVRNIRKAIEKALANMEKFLKNDF